MKWLLDTRRSRPRRADLSVPDPPCRWPLEAAVRLLAAHLRDDDLRDRTRCRPPGSGRTRAGCAPAALGRRGARCSSAIASCPVDHEVAASRRRVPRADPRPERDALIAATAEVAGLGVVTRNVARLRDLRRPAFRPVGGSYRARSNRRAALCRSPLGPHVEAVRDERGDAGRTRAGRAEAAPTAVRRRAARGRAGSGPG